MFFNTYNNHLFILPNSQPKSQKTLTSPIVNPSLLEDAVALWEWQLSLILWTLCENNVVGCNSRDSNGPQTGKLTGSMNQKKMKVPTWMILNCSMSLRKYASIILLFSYEQNYSTWGKYHKTIQKLSPVRILNVYEKTPRK